MPQKRQIVRKQTLLKPLVGLGSGICRTERTNLCCLYKGANTTIEEPDVGDTPPEDPIKGSKETKNIISPNRYFVMHYCNLGNPMHTAFWPAEM